MPRVTITVPDQNSQPYRFQLDRRIVSIGRGSDNDIVVDSGSVSGKHAEMVRVEGGYEIRDAGSTNGVKLDGQRQNVIPLHSDMTVHLGDVAFHFLLSDDETAALQQEKPAEHSLPQLPPAQREQPQAQAPERQEKPQVVHVSGGSGGFGMILLFVILAAAAFYIGLSIRYQKETDGSLLDGIKNRLTLPEPAAESSESSTEDEAEPTSE